MIPIKDMQRMSEILSNKDIDSPQSNEQQKPNKFWYIVHNIIAHPLLIFNTKWAEKFHDWTANKM
jgi:hypothetical protein